MKSTWLRAWFGTVALSVSGCAGNFDPANFQGVREARRAEAESILELTARTGELQTLGTVRASCSSRPGFRRLDREALSDVDCSEQRLRRALRESAARAGGEALLGTQCNEVRADSSSLRSCAAEVARFRSGPLASLRPWSAPNGTAQGTPAPSPSDVRSIDEPDASLSFRISVSFVPRRDDFARRPRTASEVRELPRLPVLEESLGVLTVSCERGCEERALRYGMLVAAGRLGAPDVAAVRCFDSNSGQACVGTVAAPEREE